MGETLAKRLLGSGADILPLTLTDFVSGNL